MFGVIKEVVGGSIKVPVTPTTFPDKTSQVWQLDESIFDCNDCLRIFWDFEHEGEFIQVLQLARLCAKESSCIDLALELSYLPYARQDKDVDNNQTFALTVFADVINEHFDVVKVLDPHSYELHDLLSSGKFIPELPEREIAFAVDDFAPDIICYPDYSAKKKYQEHIKCLKDIPYIYGEKVRESSSGNIESLKLNVSDGIELQEDARVLLTDDIVDGGKSIILLCDLLKNKTKNIGVYATHCLCSKGTEVFKDAYVRAMYDKNGLIYIN